MELFGQGLGLEWIVVPALVLVLVLAQPVIRRTYLLAVPRLTSIQRPMWYSYSHINWLMKQLSLQLQQQMLC